MLDELRVLDEIDQTTFSNLLQNLAGVTEEELDWRPHPEANSVRWILGHMIWHEEWTPDAVHGSGRYRSDAWPMAFELHGMEGIRERFARARERYSTMLEPLEMADLERELDYFGRPATVRQVLRIHTTHLAGSRFQIRYVRGTYSRAHATDKRVFDPW